MTTQTDLLELSDSERAKIIEKVRMCIERRIAEAKLYRSLAEKAEPRTKVG